MNTIWTGAREPKDAKEGDLWIASAWADAVLRVLDPKRQEERAWLRASLEADLLPDWCIEMVMENW